ncbi:MAG: tetratricopeptide repeat protein [Candidatus Thorarchaeota archaeon]
MEISRRIVVTFVTVSLIPILIISALSATTIFGVSQDNAGDAANALHEEELANLLRISNDTRLYIEERTQSYIDGVYMMESYCEDLFNGRINATTRHSYYWDPILEPETIPPFETDPDVVDAYYSNFISFDIDCYYMPRPYYRNNDPFDLSPKTAATLDITSNMVNIFSAIHEMNPDYVWLYMGFDPAVSDQHLMRNYPYDNLWYFQQEDPGVWLNPADDYDPNVETWYTNVEGVMDDQITFTLNFDPSTDWVLSFGRPVRYDNGTLIGVVSADVSVETIRSEVLDIEVLDSGYAYLLTIDGTVLAHPELDPVAEHQPNIFELEFDSEATQEAIDFQSVLAIALAAEQGSTEFTKDGEPWILTHINVANTGFTLAIVVPADEVIEPANNILNVVMQETLLLTIALGGVLAVVAVVVGAISYRRGRAVVKPINEMTSMVEKMSKQDFTRGVTVTGAMFEEIGTTVDALLSFQEACRFGNQAFIRGDLNRALANYQNLLEISRRLKIEVGEQTMSLNIGNVFRQRGDTGNALDYYGRALTIANQLLEKAKSDSADESDAMIRIASVYHNMALVKMDVGDYSAAMKYLEDAEAVDRTLGNNRGLARRFDAMGLNLFKAGRHSQALSRFKEAQQIAKSENYERALAYVHFHMGTLFADQSKWKKAHKEFDESIQLSQSVEEYWLAVHSMNALAEVLDHLNKPSHELRRQAEKLRRSIMFKKSVIFVIDYSGSMRAQDRIKAAVAGAKEILDSQVNPQDEVSIIVFNSGFRELLPLTVKGEYKNPSDSPIYRTLDALRHPNNATAFYDALGKALVELDRVESSEHRWVIALTDGQDNSSKHFSLDALQGVFTPKQRLKKTRKTTIEGYIRNNHLDVNLIIIGVGGELKASVDTKKRIRSPKTGRRLTIEELLESVCMGIPQGQYLSVVDSRDVRIDIERAFQEIGVLMAQMEVGGTTVDY